MALITPGPMVGQISGRLASVVFSHNRGGPYARNGTIPTLVTSDAAINAKARLSAQSQAWDNLTAIQRLAWLEYARSNPVVNRLGSQVTVGGNAAFVGINTRLAYGAYPTLTDPPIADPPVALATMSLAMDIGIGASGLTYTVTPLGANEHLYVWACLLDNPAINYVENLLRLIIVSGAAQASPYDFSAALEARFGTLIVGQKVVARVFVLSDATGLVSAPFQDDTIIVST